jgi:hypothetical protein
MSAPVGTKPPRITAVAGKHRRELRPGAVTGNTKAAHIGDHDKRLGDRRNLPPLLPGVVRRPRQAPRCGEGGMNARDLVLARVGSRVPGVQRPRMGDIGEPLREIELEPIEAPGVPEPVRTPAPAPAPVEPEKVPA